MKKHKDIVISNLNAKKGHSLTRTSLTFGGAAPARTAKGPLAALVGFSENKGVPSR